MNYVVPLLARLISRNKIDKGITIKNQENND